jgi:hypothetical protein
MGSARSADTALRLGHWFGTSPEFWLNLQKLYELRLAREEVGDRVERLPKLTGRKRTKARGEWPNCGKALGPGWRVIFKWINGEAHGVRIVDYH